MLLFLNDNTKFNKLGPVEARDHTTSIEVKFQKQLRKWVKNGLLSPKISDSIQHVGSIRPRLHGLSKIHKDGVPLRPILSMIGSAQQRPSVGFHQCFNLFWSTLVVSALKILFFFFFQDHQKLYPNWNVYVLLSHLFSLYKYSSWRNYWILLWCLIS